MNGAAWPGGLLPFGLAASLLAAPLAIVALRALLRVTGGRRSARARFAAWFILLAVLATVAPAFVVSAVFWNARVPAVALPHVEPRRQALANLTAVASDAALPIEAPYIRPSASRRNIEYGTYVAILWLAGFGVSLVRIAFGIARLMRLKKRATVVETRVTSRGTVRVLAADLFDMPVAVGYLHPVIVLPRALATGPDTDFENVVLHELEHLRRFDDVSTFAQAVCLSALWFNPFAQYIANRIAVEREMACDEAVVETTGKRASYAATLWKIATSESVGHSLMSAFNGASQTVARVTNLLEKRDAKPASPWSALASSAALAAAILGGVIGMPAAVWGSPAAADFASAPLNDGGTLVVGGRRSDGSIVTVAQLFDRKDRRIAVLPMPLARRAAVATRLASGDVLITGGITPNGTTAEAELYHVKQRRFERISPMHVARARHSATLLPNGDVLIASGERADGAFVAQTELFSASRKQFTQTVDGAGRVGQTTLVIDTGDVLMYGGRNAAGRSRCIFIYDSARRSYHEAGTLVRVDVRAVAFRLPSGMIVNHRIRPF